MNAPTSWQAANDTYLSAALAWLRLRLAGDQQGAQVAQVALQTCEATRPAPALIRLAQRLGLSTFEREILLLCAAMELDPQTADRCAQAHADPQKRYPTFALALSLFDDPAWDALSPERPLRYWRLVEIGQPGATPLVNAALRADERIVNAIKGLDYLDDRLAMLVTPDLPANGHDDELAASQCAAAETILAALQRTRNGRLPAVQLLGADEDSKLAVARRVAGEFRLALYRLPPGRLPTHLADVEEVARLWQRENLLLPLAIYIDAQEVPAQPGGSDGAAGGGDGGLPALRHLLGRVNGLVFLDRRDLHPPLAEATLAVEVARPTSAEQSAAWQAAFQRHGGGDDAAAAALSAQFDMSLAAIARTAEMVTLQEGQLTRTAAWQQCLAQSRPALGALAQRVAVKATWADLVLPPEQVGLLRQLAGQVRQRSRVYSEWGFGDRLNRGLGINALFTGESGTGKTMAAEVIASELQLDLYRIDLSMVVSKYIGETEKNLRRVFDAAEDGGAILLFDEADALFGKRSEVKDSHDRYANIEINYLLQRMESYRGLAILATNMKNALDGAFLRRLRFIVAFPYPGAADRKAIWQRVFPAQMPCDGIDFERLARLNLSGGNIQSVALNAAFLAAAGDTPVTMAHLLAAARDEYRKLERPVNEAEFRL